MAGNDANTVLLVQSETTNGSTTVVDTGAGAECPRTLTVNTSMCSHSTATSKFGSSSLKITAESVVDIGFTNTGTLWKNIINGDWTFDTWAKFPSNVEYSNVQLFMLHGGPSNPWANLVHLFANKVGTAANGNYRFIIECADNSNYFLEDIFTVSELNANEWHHYALRKDGSTLLFYVDGVLAKWWGLSQAFPTNAEYTFQCMECNGPDDVIYLEEYRFSDIDRYPTGNFTPPTAPYSEEEDTTVYFNAEYMVARSKVDSPDFLINDKIILESGISEVTILESPFVAHAQVCESPNIIVTSEPPRASLTLFDDKDALTFESGADLAIEDAQDVFSFTAIAGLAGTLSLEDAEDSVAALPGGELSFQDAPDSFALSGMSEAQAVFSLNEAVDSLEMTGLSGAAAELDAVDASDLFAFTGQPTTTGGMILVDSIDTFSMEALPGSLASLSLSDLVDAFSMTGFVHQTAVLAILDDLDGFTLSARPVNPFTDHIIQYQKSRY